MTTLELLSKLRSKDIQIWADGDRLRCNAPKGVLTPDLRKELAAHKSAILALLRKADDVPSSAALPLKPVERSRDLPLSFAQQRLWFLNQLGTGSAYNIPLAIRLSGLLNIKALEDSLNEIIRRHESLRTTFRSSGGSPVQVIAEELSLVMPLIDLKDQPKAERELAAKRLARNEAIRRFDLVKGPLLNAALIRLSEDEHILLLTMHHIITDGWSTSVFTAELATLYKAYCIGEASPLAELPIQYADFVHWQREWLQGEVLENQVSYWRRQLEGVPVLRLFTDRPRPSVQTYEGARQNIALSPTLTSALHDLCRRQGVTLFMTMLAAFQTLLFRYTGQEDIVVGSPIANRNRTEIEGLIGFFVNSLAMRTDLSGNPTFSELIRRVQGVALGAYEHQDLPFEKLVEKLNPERDMSHNPLFQIIFAIQSLSVEELQLPGLTLSPFAIERVTANFDIELHLWEKPEGLSGMVVYNIDLFDDATITRLVGHYETLLASIVADPDQHISDVQILTDTERKQMLVDWNDTSTYYPNDKCIHCLFEEQVERTPDSVAVIFKDQQLTYQELNQRANQLAHHLQSLGVGPEVLVGICVERSLEMLVGLLAILKAGGAYVPLDPNYPRERLGYILACIHGPVVLTQSGLGDRLPPSTAHVLALDEDWESVAQAPASTPENLVTPQNLAYVIYTSGSTGRPKGVAIPHAGIVNRLRWMQDAYQLDSTDHVLQKTPFSFDVSVWEFFWPLITGADLVIAKPGGHKDSAYLSELIAEEQITTLHFVPPMLAAFLEEPGIAACGSLRRVICSGEALPFELMQRHYSRLGVPLHNLYGPTESSVDVTYWACERDTDLGVVPIGRPIANTQIYILDSELNPVPVGVKGDLYIGGVQLARGYLNRPELTAEKFIPDAFSETPGTRLYKTGDLSRFLPDGNIEFLGRIDHQVKIRGFRIELGEVEATLVQQPSVREAVVIDRTDGPGDGQLVGYITPNTDLVPEIGELRAFLQQKLPEYMVPSAFVTLDTLPLTANGKIDRQALPAPDGEIFREEGYVAPRTEIEQSLAKIWQELLLKEQVGIDENFFEIGGDSILSIQVVSRAKNSGIQITAKQIFQNQTIADLATVANTTVNVRAQQGVVTGVAPLTPIQRWFWAQNRKAPHHYNQSFVLEISDRLQPELLEKAVAILLEHHDALRIRFTSVGSVYQQMNQGLDESVPFTVVDLSSTSKRSQTQALAKIATDYQGSLNLYTGPLMQVVLFNLGRESGARLLMIIHHLVVDGVSWRILLSDLKTIYEQLATQQPIQLSAKTTSFIDWAGKLYNYAQSEIVQQELAYWLSQSWAKTAPIPVDYDRARSENTLESRSKVSMRLTVEEARALLGPANEAYNTQVNDLLLSALTVSLAEWTGNSAVLIDLEGHGREELFEGVDLTRTVGWFTSMFPIVLELPRDNQSASRIKSIKEQLRGIPNRGLGYGILRYLCEDSTVKDQIVKTPKAQIVFNFLGQFDQIQTQTGWKFTSQSRGSNQNVQQTRDHLLEVNSWVVEGQLQIDWVYSRNFHSKETVEKIAQGYSQAIRAIIEHCQSEDSFGYTPSDFPDAILSQSELDELLDVEIGEDLDSI
jgi:amino acid adenylation domain-containing protein/non-ribosomal peptide synthase protein (TIGR01720 family)